MTEPTEAAKELLAQAAADYAAHQNIDRGEAGLAQTSAILAAQRAAAIKWSTPPEARAGDRDAK